MRTILLVILLSLSSLLADSSLDLEVKIIQKILQEVSIGQEKVIWSDNKEICSELRKKSFALTTSDCKKATILILQNKKNLPQECNHCPVFVLNYELLSEIPQSFGAFFWKKARPNIVILKPRLKKFFIKASSDLDPYLEEKIW